MTTKENLRNDIPAGIVVFFVAVPLCLGIALASGAPLFSGLMAGIVGGIVVGAISGSALGVSGPAAGLAVIVASAIGTLGSFEAFLVAVVLAGLMQIALGVARAGELAYFFPSSVIKGMLSGIGLLIVLKQIPHAVGWDSDPEGDLAFRQLDGENTFSGLFRASEHIDFHIMLVAAVALAILVLWEKVLVRRAKLFQIIQGPLVAVAFGIAYQLATLRFAPALSIGSNHLVQIPVLGSLSNAGSLLVAPDWSCLGNPNVYIIAATIAVVASLETLLCVEATDKLDPEKRVTPTNRELVAQGAGNAISGLLGGLPVTQVIVRSSANIQSGARSKASAVIHGVMLLFAVLFMASLLNLVPLAVLASILLVVGYKLAKPQLFVSMYRLGPAQFGPFVVTIVGILLTDLLNGVLLGLALGVMIVLHRSYVNSYWVSVEEHDEAISGHHVHVRFAEHVPFLSRGAILSRLAAIPPGSHVTIDMSRTVVIDHDVQEILAEFEESAGSRELTIEMVPSARELDPIPNAA